MEVWYQNKVFGLFLQTVQGLYIVYQYVAFVCLSTLSLSKKLNPSWKSRRKIKFIAIFFLFLFLFYRELVLQGLRLECTLNSLNQMSLNMMLMLKLP